ncbi:MAG TPA: hypothetical protein VKQ72_12480 [Aggregatilineales bacterium]|nr:hypothetical protein [Aggregatilineales bacterium]
MSAIPIRQPRQDVQRTYILEISNTGNLLDLYGDRLTSQGYEVLTATNYSDALKLARQHKPCIIIVYDDPTTNVDALRWLEIQHTDSQAQLAMIPLLVLADATRLAALKDEQMPDRVVVLQRRSDTLNQLTRAVKTLIRVWGMD